MSETPETISIEITPLFYNREALSKASTFCSGDKGTVVYAWSRLELERGQSALIRANTTVLQNKVSLEKRFVETAGFKGMEQAGMIIIGVAAAGEKVMTDTHFDTFWKRYPERITDSGKKTRGVKSAAKRAFYVHIQTLQQFDDLLRAADEYTTVAGQYPKDAERFLRVYKDYVPSGDAPIGTPVATKVPQSIEEKKRIQAEREQDLIDHATAKASS